MENRMKQALKTTLLVLTTGHFIFTCLYANDTYLGSVGGNAFNEDIYDKKFVAYKQSDSIEMVREIVKISICRDSFFADCRFWFYNHGKQETVFFGFPNTTSSEAIGTGKLRNFATYIKGNKIDVGRAIQVTDYEEIRDSIEWFRWAYKVPSRETLIIDNHYSGQVGFIFHGSTISYVIGTGSTWYGPITNGRITFDFSRVCTDRFMIKEYNTGTSLKPRYFRDSVVYEFNKYKPHFNEVLRVDYLSYWRNFNAFDPKMVFEDAKPTKIDYKLMRNEIYARHGYVFKDTTLINYFSKMSWYKPNHAFRETVLKTSEKGLSEYLKLLEEAIKE